MHTRHDINPVIASGYVPVIDLAPAIRGTPSDRLRAAEAIDDACTRSGFLVVVGHGIDPDLISRTYEVTAEFFLKPDHVKERSAVLPGDGTMRGFHRQGRVAASMRIDTPPDLCENYSINRLGEPGAASRARLGDNYERLATPNRWPEEPSQFRPTWMTYFASMEGLARELLHLFALAIGVTETWFDDKVDDHMTSLAANYYPAQQVRPQPGQLRKGPHTDWGSFTILFQDGAPGGLQVRDREGQWVDVPAIAGSFVINIGDLMAVWTNDRWVSTLHRVVNPIGDNLSHRISIPFFHQPNFDAVIECVPSCASDANPPRYPAVTSGAWLAQRLQLAFG